MAHERGLSRCCQGIVTGLSRIGHWGLVTANGIADRGLRRQTDDKRKTRPRHTAEGEADRVILC
jgi:hypothetical protein